MLKRLSKLSYFCANVSHNNLAFQGFKNPIVGQQLAVSVPANQQKLDALANVIISLNGIQIQYLLSLQNQRQLAQGRKITDNQVFGTGNDKISAIQYLYQKKWLQQIWKDYHIMSSLFSDEGDKQGVQQAVEQVKQIYQFQLTSVDAAQKIKIIKIIRQLLNLGLKEAKDIVDKAPVIMKKGKRDQGEKLKEQLAKSGCVVTLK